jgi:spore coat protein A
METEQRRKQIVARVPALAWVMFTLFVMCNVGYVLAVEPLDPGDIPKYVDPLVIPPAMPRTGKIKQKAAKNIEYYEIAVRQFQQQVLPTGFPMTTVWSYGSVNHPWTFNYPAFTIEAKWRKPVRVKWINDLVNPTGNYLSHLLPVDQTLHWANPPGGLADRDKRGTDPNAYTGPVPIITHVHGAHTFEESDGYPEAWYLPAASDIPSSYAAVGSKYSDFNIEFQARYSELPWEAGTAMFQYANDQRATTLWYHDHTLGMTRVNVYAGPAGFYIIRGGPDDAVIGTLPGPAPGPAQTPAPPGMQYYEIPIVIQDRSFNDDGSLFYPDNRAFFEGLNTPPTVPYLDIPFIPAAGCIGDSDVSPIWLPEFFGNTIVVNGRTWPFHIVEARRYRFRLLNGCNSRFLILQFDTPVPFWQIGADGGFLAAPVDLTLANASQLLLGPAERADVIVDFTNVPAGTTVTLLNLGPDEPFGGGIPGVDFPPADPTTTGQVLEFRMVAATGPDTSTPPNQLVLPPVVPLVPTVATPRQISLNEEESKTVFVAEDANGSIILDCSSTIPFGPTAAMLGTLNPDGTGNPLRWMDPITENPNVNSIEVWEIHNFTMDAHPIHIHLVQFQVVDRQPFGGIARPPEVWEIGFKDTVICYPGEVTRVKASFDIAGLYVWHCHIIEHEDNEMMRPYEVVGQ